MTKKDVFVAEGLLLHGIGDEAIFVTQASQIMKHNEKKITFSDIVKLNVTKGHTCVIHANTCVRGGRHVMHAWTHIKTARSIRLYCVKIPVFGCLAAWSASRWHVAWEPVLASWDLHYPLDHTLHGASRKPYVVKYTAVLAGEGFARHWWHKILELIWRYEMLALTTVAESEWYRIPVTGRNCASWFRTSRQAKSPLAYDLLSHQHSTNRISFISYVVVQCVALQMILSFHRS